MDCNQFEAEANFQRWLDEWEVNSGQQLNHVYDHSKYFNSMRYLNNVHVDDLILQMKEEDRKYTVLAGAQSQLYDYLRQYNFNFLSTDDEDLYKVNDSKCEDDLLSINSIEPCLERTNDRQLTLTEFSANPRSELKDDLKDLINNFRASERLSKEICEYFVRQVYGSNIDLNQSHSYSNPPNHYQMYQTWTYHCTDQFRLTKEQLKKCKVHLSDEKKHECESRERTRNRTGLLNIERKIRAHKTGRYFYKGGKSQNINVGASFSLDNSHRFGESWSGGLGPKGLKSLIRGGLTKFLKRFGSEIMDEIPIADAISDSLLGDIKIGGSEINSRSNSTTINEQTFLVMQDAMMDIELLEYTKCISIYLNPGDTAYSQNIENQARQKALNDLHNDHIAESDFEYTLKKYLLEMRRGLFICEKKESNRNHSFEPLAIREHYYYFTQHFTEGDMLDTADLYNHPWLYQIRGKTDVWRFLDRIKARKVDLSDGIGPRGEVVKTHRWPIEQLISAYSGIIPSFPGIYTMLHNEHEYAAEFPWSDQPSESLRFLNSIPEDNNISKTIDGPENDEILPHRSQPESVHTRSANPTQLPNLRKHIKDAVAPPFIQIPTIPRLKPVEENIPLGWALVNSEALSRISHKLPAAVYSFAPIQPSTL